MIQRNTRLMGLLAGVAGLVWSAGAAAQTVEITYWQYFLKEKEAVVNELIAEFEKENPGIKVKHETFPYANYGTKVASSVPAGVGPDVINLFYGWLPQYLKGGYLQPLPEKDFPAAEVEKDFFDLVQAAKVDGKYYALPTAVRSLALFYNKDLFSKAGLDPTKPPATLQEYLDYSLKMTERDGKGNIVVAGSAVHPAGQGQHFIREVLFRQWGVSPYSPDNKKVAYNTPAGAEAFQWYLDLITKHKVGFPGFMTDDVTAFRSGKAAMNIDGSFRLAALSAQAGLNYGVAELPAHNGVKSNFASFWAHGITSSTKGAKLDASVKFLKYITSEKTMKVWLAKVGELPARKSVALTPENLNHPLYGPFIRGLDYAHATYFIDESGQRQVMLDAVDEAVSAGRSGKDAVKAMAEREQQLLDEFYGK